MVTLLIEEMCSKVRLLQAQCDSDDSDALKSSSAQSTGGWRAFKIIVLFQNTAVPYFFDIVLDLFRASTASGVKEDLSRSVKLMAECLGLFALRLKAAKNQLDYKMNMPDSEGLLKIRQFCTMANLIDVVKHLLPSGDSVVVVDGAVDLVRAILSLISVEATLPDDVCLLLELVLQVVQGGKLKAGAVVRLIAKVNSVLVIPPCWMDKWV